MPSTETVTPPDNDAPATTPILLDSIRVWNFLSFGSNNPILTLSSLNILVGANGSGKSNLIDAIALLRATPGNMAKIIQDGGGVQEWIWNGNLDATAWIEATVSVIPNDRHLVHHIAFRADSARFMLTNEEISEPTQSTDTVNPTIYYRLGDALPNANAGGFGGGLGGMQRDESGSALRVLRDPVNRPELAYLADQYERIRIYREWHFGRNSLLRKPQAADMPLSYLAEDFSNLGLFLNRLCGDPKTKKIIVSYLRALYEGVDDLWFDVVHGFVQLNLIEGEHKIPASRLSDGTLHYLCLLAILCDPNPPPLICIEEPELGLHPDILPKITDLLIDASTRTQLIVTTHSEMIVDAMTEQPESVLVCEKRDGQTSIEHLDPVHLRIWLDKYRLGELWSSGELGGTRW